MQIPQSIDYMDRFSVTEALALKDNLEKGLYDDALEYLTGDGEEQRGLSISTLSKYNVGLGTEKFTDDHGIYQGYDSIYFPLYMPKISGGEHSRLGGNSSMKKANQLKLQA